MKKRSAAWNALKQEADLLEQSLDLTRTRMNIVKFQLDQGMASTTDFTDSNLELTQAELGYRSQLLMLLLKANQIDALSRRSDRKLECRGMKNIITCFIIIYFNSTYSLPVRVPVKTFAYTGRMEVDTITVSSQATGAIESLEVQEGDSVEKDRQLGRINTDRLEAQRRQQDAQMSGFAVKRSAAEAQITQAQAQLSLARETLSKTEKLLAQGGATQQRRDELSTQVSIDNANLAALQSNYRLIAAQEKELKAGMDITDIAIGNAENHIPAYGRRAQ